MRPLRGFRRGESSDSLQLIESSEESKAPSERVLLLVLGALLAAALVLIFCLIRTNVRTNVSFQTLREEHEALRRNVTEGLGQDKQSTAVKQKYWKCEKGWEQDGGKCYYFSMARSPWSESRTACQLKGGDLVKIESREEQDFMDSKLPELMDDSEDMFWIGLTDSETEGRWLWVDGSLSDTGFTFWDCGQPDNLMHDDTRGQDCARVGGLGMSKHWFDRSCRSPQKSICEKPAEKAETGLGL